MSTPCTPALTARRGVFILSYCGSLAQTYAATERCIGYSIRDEFGFDDERREAYDQWLVSRSWRDAMNRICDLEARLDERDHRIAELEDR